MTVPHGTTGNDLAVNLLTAGDYQFALWYTLAGELRVGRIERGVHRWGVDHVEYQFASTPRTALGLPVEADEHNYATMAVDGLGKLHVWANMHNDTMRAVASTTAHTTDGWLATAGWASATTAFPSAASRNTYPQAIRRPDGALWFYIRAGEGISSSGNADSFYWTRAVDGTTWSARTMIFQGLSVPDAGGPGITGGDATVDDMTNWNAYPHFYQENPGEPHPGRIHMLWAWREVPGVEINVLPSYGYSDDGGISWRTVTGANLTVPIHPLNSVAARLPGCALIRNVARGSNIVVAEVDTANHGIVGGDPVRVLVADASYNGDFTVGAVLTGPPRIAWGQTAADDAAGGVGSIGRAEVTTTLHVRPAIDDSANPHLYIKDYTTDIWHFTHNGTSWSKSAIPGTLAGFSQTRPAGWLWFRGALWPYGLSSPPAYARRSRLWRLPSTSSVAMSGDLGNTANYSMSIDPEAWRRFGSIETLAPDGDKPRVYTWGTNARIEAVA